MNGRFALSAEVESESLDRGVRRWFSTPSLTGADDLMLIEVTLESGFGHTFHRHPDQEEIVFVLEGEIEHFIETKRRTLRAGDTAFMKRGTVHGSFNESGTAAKVLAIVGPCRGIGSDGYDVIEVADQAPWNTLRPNSGGLG